MPDTTDQTELRARIVAEARSWVGTPYRNCADIKGKGCDCAGFLAGVYRNVGIAPPDFVIGPYNHQWALHNSAELYAAFLLRYLREVTEEEVQPGDIILYRSARTFSHSAIILNWPGEVLHAIRGDGVVLSHGTKESWLQGRARRYFSLK